MRYLICFVLIFNSSQMISQQKNWNTSLLTTPVKSDYQKTSTYADVISFIEAVQSNTDLVHVESMGKSMEGKEIPLVVMANPKVSNPEEAKATGKPVVYIQGNIHSGEVEGKEVLLQLMRDITLGDKKYLLDNQIILFAPIYNADSNDKMEKGRRPSQEDSPVEVGIRANSQGFDLNRDGVKLEAFETQSLIQHVIINWDPELFMDLHTTNGTWHGYGITWAPSYHYAGEVGPYNFTWDKLLPEVTAQVDQNYEVKMGPYGYFFTRQGWPPKSLYTYNHHPRYLVNQMGLRNKVGILSEAFAHDRFYKRMVGTYGFVAEVLEFTHKNGYEMAEINDQAEIDAIDHVLKNAGKVEKGVRFKMVPLKEKLNDYRAYDYIPFEDESGKVNYKRSGQIKTFDGLDNYSAFEATVQSTLPRGYYLPKSMAHIAEHLKKHGIKVTTLSKNKRVKGDVFTVQKLLKAKRKFEGHFMATAEGDFKSTSRSFKKGDFYIDMAQPLTNLIFYLLEPQSDDGLVTWNFFDTYLEEKGVDSKPVEYPVFKVYN